MVVQLPFLAAAFAGLRQIPILDGEGFWNDLPNALILGVLLGIVRIVRP